MTILLEIYNSVRYVIIKPLTIMKKILFFEKKKEFLFVTLISLLLISGVFFTTVAMTPDHKNYRKAWDHQFYIIMANDPFGAHQAPYCYRIFVPWLVSIFPEDLHPFVFRLQSFLFLSFATIVLYYLIRKLNYSRTIALGGMLFFASSYYMVKYTLMDFWLTDSAAIFFILLLFYIAFCEINIKNAILAGFIMVIGVMTKESVLFVAPLFYTYRATRVWDKKAIMWAATVSLTGIVTFLCLRRFISTTGDYEDYSTLFNSIGIFHINGFWPSNLEPYLFGSFGVALLVLPVFALVRNLNFTLKSLPFLILVYTQVLFAVNIERLVVYAIPVVIICSLNGMISLCEKYKIHIAVSLVIPASCYLILILNYPLIFTTYSNVNIIYTVTFIISLMILMSIGELESVRHHKIQLYYKRKKSKKEMN